MRGSYPQCIAYLHIFSHTSTSFCRTFFVFNKQKLPLAAPSGADNCLKSVAIRVIFEIPQILWGPPWEPWFISDISTIRPDKPIKSKKNNNFEIWTTCFVVQKHPLLKIIVLERADIFEKWQRTGNIAIISVSTTGLLDSHQQLPLTANKMVWQQEQC